MNLTSLTIRNYSGSTGGGLYISISDSFKKFTDTIEIYYLNQVHIIDCHSNENGGGIALWNINKMEIRDSLIEENTALQSGGGIYFKCYVGSDCELDLGNDTIIT